MGGYIDTDERATHYRLKGLDKPGRRVLLTEFAASQQSQDLTLSHNCQGVGRIHHFRRAAAAAGFAPNPLPLDPASRALGQPRPELMQAQVFQNAVCSWRCWYCFVDYALLDGNPRRSRWLTADELLDLYLAEPVQCPVIDLSGGQPDLVPEWVGWMTDALQARNLTRRVYLWSDDNLSNEYLWQCLSAEELRRLVRYPTYGRVGCFKGFDADSFAFNTRADPALFARQFTIMRRLVATGLDVYGYVTLTAADDRHLARKVADLVTRLQEEVHPLFPLRTVPLPILAFTPTRGRMGDEHHRALAIQQQAVAAWHDTLAQRFPESLRRQPIDSHDLGVRANLLASL